MIGEKESIREEADLKMAKLVSRLGQKREIQKMKKGQRTNDPYRSGQSKNDKYRVG